LGHIDHGKTSLLDWIRKTQVTQKETGGITQHIGAYEIEKEGKKITFLDTPGHEIFSAMRARGTKVADIAILVVDTTQGVQSQTKEAILHIKKSAIPLIVALNKIDRPEADPEKTKRELSKEGILLESMGGKIPSIKVSAKTGQGISDLLELILLVAEMEELRTFLEKPAQGLIIESYLDSKRGPTATLISNQGILRPGQIIGTYSTLGKIKILENFQGFPILEAFPSQPVICLGFKDVPGIGEEFKVFSNIEKYQSNLKIREKKPPKVIFLEKEQKILNLILKADVLGSLEAIEEVLENLPQKNIVLRILQAKVGEITESDVKLAIQAKAKILGFRVKINSTAQILAEREKIKISQFNIIYDLIEEVRKYLDKLPESQVVRIDLGKVKSLVIFLTEKNRQVIGGKVIEGEIKKGAQIEILRTEEIIGQGKIIKLQKNKKDVERVLKGEECGILYEGEVKIKEGDILLIYVKSPSKS